MKEKQVNQYLVVAPPRGGFTLLLSVLSILYRDRGNAKPSAQAIADPYIAIAGEYLDAAIRDWFGSQVGEDRLFYSKEFSILVGGPKWVSADDTDTVCVRKYLGIKGEGDFTFLLYLPRWVMAFDEIIHSHSHPARWPAMPDYAEFRKFASIRNPIDIIHSSVFSINALASEYIQRELKFDEHQIRRELALNKLTNIEFISGLIVFLKSYLDEFIPVIGQYDYLMRWEDLIQQPVEEIQRIAQATGEPVSAEYAARVWSELDHRNLTRYHRHSFRRGLLNDWQFNITNTHLKLFEDAEFGAYLERFGYDPITYFDESSYTPDQVLIEEHIRREQPYMENLDNDLITFAFNKTNFTPSPRFKFKHYPRQGAIEIEKSTLRDEALESGFMSRMASVSETVYQYLTELRLAATAAADDNKLPLQELRAHYSGIFSEWLGDQAETMFSALTEFSLPEVPPRLVGSVSDYNIVAFGGLHYAVPQMLGSMDLSQLDMSSLPPEILAAHSYDEAIRLIEKRSEK
ncbi:MAG: sulfotransferase domain-containing protein [Chloroflexi bacterium]|nr:sulfotransferase domain-containing protein [Chloroflexota bacterium]